MRQTTFVCSYVASPFGPSEPKRPPWNHVILLLIYAHRQKFRIFTFTRRRRGDRKSAIFGVLGWVFCLSATANIEHQICTQKHGLLADMS